MKVKNTLRLIDFSQSFLAIVAVLLVLLLAQLAKGALLVILEVLLALTALIVYLFRTEILNWIIRKSPHPGLAYAVLEKLEMAEDLGLSLPDDLRSEIDDPPYSTEAFLKENGLRARFTELKFEDKGLVIQNQTIPWPNVYYWEYENRGRYKTDKIIVSYYDEQRNIQTVDIPLFIGFNKVDILLLLTHFKGKYGQVHESLT
jgi:hypothetical protein